MIKRALIEKANRLYQLPPDIFAFAREKTRPTRLKKVELLDLARFHWPVAMEPGSEPTAKQFAPTSAEKLSALKEALAQWCNGQFGVKLNPVKEIHVGGRISSLIFATALAFVDNGDVVFVPDVGLPLYKRVTTACGGEPVHYSLSRKNDWRPDFERMNSRLGRVARLLFLNSPHNPTGMSLDQKEMENLVWMAARENIVIANDAAYQSINPRRPVSLMSVTGGKKVGVEIYSFAYQFGLPSFPFGFVVGNREVIGGLELASNLMPGHIPDFFVDMALAAIRQYPGQALKNMRETIQRNGAEATKFLELLSLQKSNYDTVPFVWAAIPSRKQARTKAGILYRRSRILTAPGTAFGDNGEGYLRLSLTASHETFRAATDRVKKKVNLLKMDNDE